jgi:hypothetical protein
MKSPVQDKSGPLHVSTGAMAALSPVERAIATVMIDAGALVIIEEKRNRNH